MDLQAIKQRYGIVGNCEALNHVLDVALQVAPTKLSVLIAGESGVGKEIIPRVIHDNSPRRREKYFAINCGSIPEGTIDSELFGHVKGSYTGAINDSPGYFGAANKGTLFLDEVGELPLATQARLLRVLENGEYIPVGATDVKKTDVRIVAATNVNIQKAISEGRFREDLYYRLNEVPMQMPPLRERGEDIVLLFRLFAMQMAEEYRMDKVVLTDEAKQVLMRYKWPGNIRQLKNITRQISVLSPERTITADMLRTFIPQDHETTELATIHRTDGGDHSFENEREILYKILFELRGNVNEMRHEMSQLKKRLDEAQSQPLSAPAAASTQLAPITPISPITPITSPAAVDAMAEEYIEPEKEPENLNLNDLGKAMLEKALERNHGNRRKAAQELGISDRTLYRRLKQFGLATILLLCLLIPTSCSVSYKFNGASIDYSKTKTIQIAEFPIRAAYIWAPMGPMFNNEIKSQFSDHTRLELVKRNGDLKLEGEITRYDQRNKGVSSEGHSSMVELSMTVNVRFTNNTNHNEDFEQQFTATASYESTLSLNAVQDELVAEMVKNICEQIFNAAVANW